MYDINLSFYKSKEVETSISELQKHYDLCYKNNIADFLSKQVQSDIQSKSENRELLEILCSGIIGHCFCEINENNNVKISKNDYIILGHDDGLEIALVREVGEIVKLKYQKLLFSDEKLPSFIRKADEDDLKHLNENFIEENKAKQVFKEKVIKHNLEMKLVDVHFQFDKKRLFFFYTADGRVDFRELAKDLASVFKTRIELRQIGVRDETKRIGGIGSCGREFCCSSFITNFKKISTHCALDNNSSTNLSKLSGPCGKLKCCLSFEIDT